MTDAGRARCIEVVARGVGAFLATVEIRGRAASVQSADRRLNLYCTVAPDRSERRAPGQLGDRARHEVSAGRRRRRGARSSACSIRTSR